MPSRSWTCLFCDRPTTITDEDYSSDRHLLRIKNEAGGEQALISEFVVCPNVNCKKVTLIAQLSKGHWIPNRWQIDSVLGSWRLVPDSSAKAFPDYVPQAIRDDYIESCRIRDLSPKASATLSRRCLRGMVRDFWGIKKPRLIDEIKVLKDQSDPNVWAAIDAVRSVGNIGAHMEKDVDLIVDVEPDEAEQLIALIEMLLTEWYVARYERQRRLEEIQVLAHKKQGARESSAAEN